MLVGYNDGTVKVLDVDNVKKVLLEYKFDGGKIKDIFFTSALYGVLTVTVEDGRVFLLKVTVDPGMDGSYSASSAHKPEEMRGKGEGLRWPKLLEGD